MEDYQELGKIGEGAFGVVVRARRIRDDKIVAIKKVRLRRLEDGLPKEAMGEVQALQLLNHPNVVKLHAVFPAGAAIAIVCEHMRADLSSVLHDLGRPLAPFETKTILWFALQGLAHCHENQLLHRDLKPANILVGHAGQIALADFGCARAVEPPGRAYSLHAATRWYRAPELLFGAREYGFAIDMWSMGSVFGELLNGTPIWCGENDIDQLSRIQSSLGTFNAESWPTFSELPDFGKIEFRHMEPQPQSMLAPTATEIEIRFLGGLLVPDPNRRPSAHQALCHDFFFSEPLPRQPAQLAMSLLQDYELESQSKQRMADKESSLEARLVELVAIADGYVKECC